MQVCSRREWDWSRQVHISFLGMCRLPCERVYIQMNPEPCRERHLEMGEAVEEDEAMPTGMETTTRAELDATTTGALVARILEITRELRGDEADTLQVLGALEDTTGESNAAD